MHIIDLTPLEEGVYNDHKADHITEPPEDWAMIPDDMTLPTTFPRLSILEAEEKIYTYEVEVEQENAETGEIEIIKETRERAIMTVTRMEEGTLPEPTIQPPTAEEQLRADVDYIAALTGVQL